MSWMLAVYSNCGNQEFIFPETNNASYAFPLDHDILGIPEDIELHFDSEGRHWRFMGASSNCTLDKQSVQPGSLISTNDFLYLIAGQERIVIIATEFTADIGRSKKFNIKDTTSVTIGANDDNDIIVVGVPLVSQHHAILTFGCNGGMIIDKSSNGTFVNGKRVRGQVRLGYGDTISLFGAQIIWLGDTLAVYSKCGQVWSSLPKASLVESYSSVDASRPHPYKQAFFRRSPRNLPPFYTDKVAIEAPPQPIRSAKRPIILTIGPSLTMALPMVIGTCLTIWGARSSGNSASMYMYTGIIIAIMSALIGTIWAFVNLRYSKKQEREGESHRISKYKDYIAHIQQELAGKYNYNKQNLNYIYPAANKCAGYSQTTPELWNRNASHSDFLFLRLGTGAMPFQCSIVVPEERFSLIDDELRKLPAEIAGKFEYLQNVPLGIDLLNKSLVGIISQDSAAALIILRDLVVQAAANVCYTDLKMVFLFNGENPGSLAAWNFAKWLPHTWAPGRKIRYFATNQEERNEVCFSLANTLRLRAEEASQSSGGESRKPHYLVFVSSPELLEGVPVSKYLLKPDNVLGVSTILFAERFEQLPNSCVDIIENDHEFSGIYNAGKAAGDRVHIDFDVIDASAVEQFARSISPIKVEELEAGGEIPETLSFLDIYHAASIEELNISDRWKKSRTYETLRVPIGQKSGGVPLYLDIHENFHGPHGLVAGTTGSGKSETLQTYILSLAVNFSPEDVAFFLIDFKGGGMASLFSRLPHMAGFISNLSGNQIHRAMVSIKSENRRRQRIFGDFGVNHIDQYTRLYKSGEATASIPHLFIIIDEFAELKHEEPDFMRELISVAQIGRSLGVHLILATQKPSGNVDENIWSNTRFKLCLRVQDKQDSNDVLHKPDAAYLTQAGRCYLQVGNDEIYELFQSGWSGAAYYDNAAGKRDETACMWNHLGQPAGTRRKQGSVTGPDSRAVTQLSAIVESIAATAKPSVGGFRLWLPILPEKLHLFDFFTEGSFNGEEWISAFSPSSLSVPVGIYDDPANQTQCPLVIDIAESGNLAVAGTGMSGKSTFMQTLLFAIAHKYPPKYVNIYILDYSNHMLEPFSDLAHVGGVVFDSEPEKVEKFFVLMSNIVEERKRLFQGGSYTQYARANRANVPYILLVIDNYAGFREKTGNQYESILTTLSREGANYGIHLLFTIGGFGAGELQNRIADNFRATVCLEMGDRFKYSEVLRTNHLDVFPEGKIKGRGLASVNGRVLEFQTALAMEAIDDYQRTERLHVCFSEMTRVWHGPVARHIPTIPNNPTWSDFQQSLSSDIPANLLPYGWNKKDASIAYIDLSKTYCWLVTGKSGTGKSSLLKVIAASAHSAECHIIEFGGNRLRKFAVEQGFGYISTAAELFALLKELLPKFKERNIRKQELLGDGLDEEDIYTAMQSFHPIFLFIDNLDEFMKNVYAPLEGVGAMFGFVENILEKGRLHNIFFFAGFDSSTAAYSMGRKAYNSFVSYKTGVHLGGNAAAQRIFDFTALPYSEQTKTLRPGTGLVPPDAFNSAVRTVVLPLLKG